MSWSRQWIISVFMCVALFGLLTSSLLFAQIRDQDGDGVPDEEDPCPYQGPIEYCPTPTPTGTDRSFWYTSTPPENWVTASSIPAENSMTPISPMGERPSAPSSDQSSVLNDILVMAAVQPLLIIEGFSEDGFKPYTIPATATPRRQQEYFLTDKELEDYDFCAISLKRSAGTAAIYTKPNATSATHGFLTDTRLVQMMGLDTSGHWLEVMALYRLDTPQDDATGYIPYDDQLEFMLRRNSKCGSVLPIAETAISTEERDQ